MKPAGPPSNDLGVRLYVRREGNGGEVHAAEALQASRLEEAPNSIPPKLNEISGATRAAALAIIAGRARFLGKNRELEIDEFQPLSTKIQAPIILKTSADRTWPVTLDNRLLTPGSQALFRGFGDKVEVVLVTKGGRRKGQRGKNGVLPGKGLRLGVNPKALRLENIRVYEVIEGRPVICDSVPSLLRLSDGIQQVHNLRAAKKDRWHVLKFDAVTGGAHLAKGELGPRTVGQWTDLTQQPAALHPAILVQEAERKGAEYIEFLAGARLIGDHYLDMPLLCEVPRTKLRERQLTAPRSGLPGRRTADARAVAVLVHDHEQCLHNSAWTLDQTPVDWRELISDFSKICPNAESSVPHFILIGVPGSGKSTFAQYIAWLASTDGEPFAASHRLAVRINLREWEEFASRPGNSPHLEAFLAGEHPASHRAGGPVQDDWRAWLESGRLILVLDGLDEVKPDGAFCHRLTNTLKHWRGCFPILITCRTLNIDAYRAALSQWPIFAPARLSDAQVRQFIENYPRLKGDLHTEELQRQFLDHPEMKSLAEVPMLLNVICYVVDQGLKLPATRAELYSVAVDRLLERQHDPPLDEFSVSDSEHRVVARRILAAIAARLFCANEGLAPLSASEFGQALEQEKPRDWPDGQWRRGKEDLKNWFIKRSGLVRVSRAGYTFFHNQFLEFLAGEGLAAVPNLGGYIAAAIHNVDAWREVIKYAARKLAQDRVQDVRDLLLSLAGTDELPASDVGWLKPVLAGEVILDSGMDGLKLDLTIGDVVRARLAALVEKESLPENRPLDRVDRKGLSTHDRAHASEVLGWLGDPRPGIGLKNNLPHIDWIEIPRGDFLMGGEESWLGGREFLCNLITKPYRIGRYPITVAQYQAFVDDNGYREERFWTRPGWQWLGRLKVKGPEEGIDRVFKTPNHPRVEVNWFEAMAFCSWLGEKLQQDIRLPSEAEWERAARGDEGRLFPWGQVVDFAARCNCSETGLGRTSAPGLFPLGKSKCGVEDLAGNVSQWCRTTWSDGYRNYEKKVSENLESNEARVLRGGSWDGQGPALLMAACRRGSSPYLRYVNVGFRCVWLHSSTQAIAVASRSDRGVPLCPTDSEGIPKNRRKPLNEIR